MRQRVDRPFGIGPPPAVFNGLVRVCSPACGGELARCEAARWRSRTEGVASSSLAFDGSSSGNPLRPAATATGLPRPAYTLPQLSLGEDTLRDKASHKTATEHPAGGPIPCRGHRLPSTEYLQLRRLPPPQYSLNQLVVLSCELAQNLQLTGVISVVEVSESEA